jgi:hypothetical protein
MSTTESTNDPALQSGVIVFSGLSKKRSIMVTFCSPTVVCSCAIGDASYHVELLAGLV